MLQPHAGIDWRPRPPAELRWTRQVDGLLEAAHSLQATLSTADAQRYLLHHDFCHRNLLWSRGRVSGVVDWNEARLGPRECDVAYCSVDVAMTAGAATSRWFVEAQAGPLHDLSRWQALWIAAQIPWLHL